jgi:hypothetical protein
MAINVKQIIKVAFHQRNHLLFILFLMTTALCFLCTDSVNGQDNNVITPAEPIELFNGEDLTGFYTWLVDHKFEDPNSVFSVVDRIDGAPAIRISGEDWGGLITEESYANYHLIAEFRWGNVTFGDRKEMAMDSGILLHAQGPEGNYEPDFNAPWMRSVEYQIIEGGTGDIILVRGYAEDGELLMPELKSTVTRNYRGQYRWDPDGEIRTYADSRNRFFWYGRDPDWTGELGFRGFQDVENPVGDWNRIEVIAEEDTFVFLLNGKVVNKGFDSSLTEGQLLFQSEGAEVFFRRIELHPISR